MTTTVYDTEQDVRGLIKHMQEKKDAGNQDWAYVDGEIHYTVAFAMLEELDKLRDVKAHQKSRAEVVLFINDLMGNMRKQEKPAYLGIGRYELRKIMDFVYGGEPTSQEEMLVDMRSKK